MADPVQDVEGIARRLTKAQRRALRLNVDERLMGGFFGLAWDAPGTVEPVGICHPIFGSHYRLTQLGRDLHAHLLSQDSSNDK